MKDPRDLPEEFRDLLDEYCSDVIDDERMRRLEMYLLDDESARRAFAAYFHLHTELRFAIKARRAADSVLRLIDDPPRRRRPGPPALWAAAALLAGLLVLLWSRGYREVPAPTAGRAPAPDSPGTNLAIVIKLDDARWESEDGTPLSEGSIVAARRLRLRSGQVTLAFFSGVTLDLEGPADLELVAIDRVFCRRGKLRARIPEGAEGFVVAAPGSAVVDLGTELGLNVAADGKAQVMVFKGKAEAAVIGASGSPRHSQLMRESEAFEIDPRSGHIETIAGPEGFLSPTDLITPSLVLDPAYPRAVLRSRPWGYWRFESMAEGAFPNEVPGRPPLHATGPIRLDGAETNRCAAFRPGVNDQSLELDELWAPQGGRGYAVELWCLPTAIRHATLAGLISPKEDAGNHKHEILLELTARGRQSLHRPASIRFLHRWPPGSAGGDNLYSDEFYRPYRWHHLVAQIDGGRMELFMDGAHTYSLPIDPGHMPTPCYFLLGRMTRKVPGDEHWTSSRRPFAGRMDEVALYDHPLTAEDVQDHYRIATQEVRDVGPESDHRGVVP